MKIVIMNYLLLCLIALSGASLSVMSDKYAEISFRDGAGENHKLQMVYLVDPTQSQFGVKYGITLYQIRLKNCRPALSKDIDEYFAAYLTVPKDCNLKDVYHDIFSHGANMVFMVLTDPESAKIVEKMDKLPVPLFISQPTTNNFDFFDKKYNLKDSVYIDVYYLDVD